MMTLVFAAMSGAFVAAVLDRHSIAMTLLLAGLALATGLFLYEIDGPQDGFRMPWLQVMARPAPDRGRVA